MSDTHSEYYKELVDFKEVIGIYIHPKTGKKQETTQGIIHYLRNCEAYIIPAAPSEHADDNNQDIYNDEIETKCVILLSVQRALLGAITPNFRSVFVDWNVQSKQILITLYFILDKDSTEADQEEAECVAAEVIADFIHGCIETKLIKIAPSQPMSQYGKVCVFKRKE